MKMLSMLPMNTRGKKTETDRPRRGAPAQTRERLVTAAAGLFNQAGSKAFEIGPLDATQLAGTRPETVPVSFTIPLKDLAPGRYTSQINVVDEVGRKFAFPRSPLVISP